MRKIIALILVSMVSAAQAEPGPVYLVEKGLLSVRNLQKAFENVEKMGTREGSVHPRRRFYVDSRVLHSISRISEGKSYGNYWHLSSLKFIVDTPSQDPLASFESKIMSISISQKIKGKTINLFGLLLPQSGGPAGVNARLVQVGHEIKSMDSMMNLADSGRAQEFKGFFQAILRFAARKFRP